MLRAEQAIVDIPTLRYSPDIIQDIFEELHDQRVWLDTVILRFLQLYQKVDQFYARRRVRETRLTCS